MAGVWRAARCGAARRDDDPYGQFMLVRLWIRPHRHTGPGAVGCCTMGPSPHEQFTTRPLGHGVTRHTLTNLAVLRIRIKFQQRLQLSVAALQMLDRVFELINLDAQHRGHGRASASCCPLLLPTGAAAEGRCYCCCCYRRPPPTAAGLLHAAVPPWGTCGCSGLQCVVAQYVARG